MIQFNQKKTSPKAKGSISKSKNLIQKYRTVQTIKHQRDKQIITAYLAGY